MTTVSDQVEFHQRIWRISNLTHVGQTDHADFFQCRTDKELDAFLKILTPLGQNWEKNGAQYLSNASNQLSVEVFEFDERASLIEVIKGERLISLYETGSEWDAVSIQVDLTLKLQAEDNSSEQYTNLLEDFTLMHANAPTTHSDESAELLERSYESLTNLIQSNC
ncbi:MAG: hypothetical protein AAF826_02285, partial [Pseudomonadota bacterium]